MLDIFEDVRKLPVSEIEQCLNIIFKKDNIYSSSSNKFFL